MKSSSFVGLAPRDRSPMVDVTEIIFEHILSETVDEGLRIERIISTGKASLPRFLNTKARGFLRGDLAGRRCLVAGT
jgi:hypothetical protein